LKISIISPHRGDACFALGVSLVRWARAGHQIRLVNCFTRSAHAPYSDADTVHPNDRMSYVTAMRDKEDKVFLRRMQGAEDVDLRLKDAPIRLRCAEQDVYRVAVNESDPAIAKITAALEKRIAPGQMDVMLLPLGIGSHVDHSTAREAAIGFATTLACGFYEDMPYGAREGAASERDRLLREAEQERGLSLSSVTCGALASAGASKRDLAEIYCSQMDEASVEQMAREAEHVGGERIWANERLLSLIAGGISGWSATSD
jgi:LmbE family N-acetylglucosaminyl deacetylase